MKIGWRPLAVMALLTACATPRNGAVSPDPHGIFSVVLLVTGTPVPDPERSGSSVAVIAGDSAYLVDAGPGVVRRAAADAKEIYFVAAGKLMAAEVSTGEMVRASAPQPLFAIPLVWSLNAEYQSIANGQEFVANRQAAAPESGYITVVLNWSGRTQGN